MRTSWRKWGVSGIAWLGVLALAGMALAGAEGEDEATPPSATLSPAEAATGVEVTSGGTLDLTLDLSADPETEYSLAVTYGGDPVGVCQTDAAMLTTDTEGAASFLCTFTAVENSGTEALTGTITFTVSLGDQTLTENVATVTVPAAEQQEEEEEEEEQTEDAEATVNHGHCVSYWAHRSKAEGLEGRARGAFISSIAQDPEAVSAKVPADGEPDATCDFAEQLAEALAEQEAAAADGDAARGKPAKAAKDKGPRGDDAEDDEQDD